VLGVIVMAAALLALGLCGDGRAEGRLLVEDAGFPVAMAPLPGGGLRYGERLTGRVREVDGRGRLRPEPVAAVEVSTDGQRGLLGLAVDGQGRTFAAWTDPPGMLLVGQVVPAPVRVLWRGPPSSNLGNGGHLELSPDGRLVVGLGDLGRGDRSGRLLGLDPDGPPDQHPDVLSSGWNNPFAFGFSPSGALWVADNAPGEEPERLVRLSQDGRPAFATDLSGRQIAPAGLVALSDSRLVLCAYLTEELAIYDVEQGRRRTLVEGCRTGVVRLTTGDLAYANEHEVRILEDTGPVGFRP
jgi:hypothetical protein